MDLLKTLRGLTSVEKVYGLNYSEDTVLNFLFFICPKLQGEGIVRNRRSTGFTATYGAGLSKSALLRINQVRKFMSEAEQTEIKFTTTAIFAAADAITLFSPPANIPSKPYISDTRILSNLAPVRKEMRQWRDFYESLEIPDNIMDEWHMYDYKFYELHRLKGLLPEGENYQDRSQNDFVKRAFANFALDGVLMRQGVFGENPVILGVESPGVALIQNAALKDKECVPIVQLEIKRDNEILKKLPRGSGGH